jgi:hypothetical protein
LLQDFELFLVRRLFSRDVEFGFVQL